jgi:hypothetical protein
MVNDQPEKGKPWAVVSTPPAADRLSGDDALRAQ